MVIVSVMVMCTPCAVYGGRSTLAEIQSTETHIDLLTAVMITVVVIGAWAVGVAVFGAGHRSEGAVGVWEETKADTRAVDVHRQLQPLDILRGPHNSMVVMAAGAALLLAHN